MDVILNNNQVLEIDSYDYHKYMKPQNVKFGSVFVMKSEFDKEYLGYGIKYQEAPGLPEKLVFFYHETLQKYGEEMVKPPHFNGEPFIRISLKHADGHGR